MPTPKKKPTAERRLASIENTLLSLDRRLKEQNLYLVSTRSQVDESLRTLEALDEKYGHLLDLVEGLANSIKTLSQERTAQQHALLRHEKRLTTLEKRPA